MTLLFLPLGGSFRSAMLSVALLLIAATSVFATPVPPGGTGGGAITAGNSPGDVLGWQGNVGGVNTGTGNKMTVVPVVSWTARGGLPVSFNLTHNSQAGYSNFNGQKWTYSYLDFVVDNGNTVLVYWDDGSVYTYTQSGSSYTPPAGIHDTLVKNGSGNFTITTKEQIAYKFTHVVSNEPGYSFLTSIGDENGNVITVTYTASSSFAVYQITDPTGRAITLGYDSYGHLGTVTDPLGRKWTLSYDSTDFVNCNLIYVYQPSLDQYGHAYIFSYDTNHDVASEQDLNGNKLSYNYNSDGSVKSGTKPSDTSPYTMTTSFAYTTTATTITDPNGHTRIDTYDANGRRVSTTDALSNVESFTYDAANNVLTDKDRNGYTWTRTYDGMGNVMTFLSPHNSAQGYPATAYTYNAHNRLLTAKLPGKESIAVTYDTYGLDNPVKVQQLNANGTVIATTTIDYPYVSATYPTNYGLADYKIDANNHKTTYGYDGNGYLSSVTTPLGHKTQWVRNGKLDVVTQRTDAIGNVTNYTPDSWLRITAVSYVNNTVYNATYGYDYNGNLTAFSNYAGNYTRSYDADNRMTAEGLSGRTILAHYYDATGQIGLLSSTVDICPRSLTYGYTARNEISSIAETTGTASYIYDNDGNLENSYNENGVQNQTYHRDENDRLLVQWDIDASNNFLQANNLTYNADGQITQAVDGFGSTTTYTYDGFLHLSSEVRTGNFPYNRSYVTDALGNRLSMVDGGTATTLYHDADDEQTTDPSGYRNYAYNANGDQTTYYNMGQPASTYAYDPEDRLISITYGGGGGVTFAYDALGRQVARATGGVTTSYYYDGDDVIDEYNGTSYAQYTWGPGGQVRRGAEYTLYDGLGSVTKMTDGSGTPTEQITLDSFGRTQNIGGTSSDPYQYKSEYGYRTDGDGNADGQGIIKVGVRYYDPLFGRFITRDKASSQAPYAYCGGDPVNNVDPSGNISSSIQTTKNPDGTTTTTSITILDNGTIITVVNVSNTSSGTLLTSTTTISTTNQNGITLQGGATTYGGGGLPFSVSISGPAGPGVATAGLSGNFMGPVSPIAQLSYGIGPVTVGVFGGPNTPVGGFVIVEVGSKF